MRGRSRAHEDRCAAEATADPGGADGAHQHHRSGLAAGQDGPRLLQGYTAQAVATEGQIVIAADVITGGNERHRLEPMVTAAREELQAAGIHRRARGRPRRRRLLEQPPHRGARPRGTPRAGQTRRRLTQGTDPSAQRTGLPADARTPRARRRPFADLVALLRDEPGTGGGVAELHTGRRQSQAGAAHDTTPDDVAVASLFSIDKVAMGAEEALARLLSGKGDGVSRSSAGATRPTCIARSSNCSAARSPTASRARPVATSAAHSGHAATRMAGVYGTHGPPDERAARPRARSRKACRRGAADGAAVTTRRA
jgi:hypothetical protein